MRTLESSQKVLTKSRLLCQGWLQRRLDWPPTSRGNIVPREGTCMDRAISFILLQIPLAGLGFHFDAPAPRAQSAFQDKLPLSSPVSFSSIPSKNTSNPTLAPLPSPPPPPPCSLPPHLLLILLQGQHYPLPWLPLAQDAGASRGA